MGACTPVLAVTCRCCAGEG